MTRENRIALQPEVLFTVPNDEPERAQLQTCTGKCHQPKPGCQCQETKGEGTRLYHDPKRKEVAWRAPARQHPVLAAASGTQGARCLKVWPGQDRTGRDGNGAVGALVISWVPLTVGTLLLIGNGLGLGEPTLDQHAGRKPPSLQDLGLFPH